MALDPLVSQATGAGDTIGVTRAIQRGLLLTVILTAVCALVFIPASPALRLLDQPLDIIPDAAQYTHLSSAGIFPYFVFVVFRESLQAMRRVAAIVWTVVIGNVVNVAFNWMFIFGHLGLPPLGIAGSAWATAISRWVMAALLLIIAWRRIAPHLAPIHPAVLTWRPLFATLRVGVPIGAQYVLEVGAFAAAALLMGTLGTVQVAAHQVAINIASVTFMASLGVSAASSVLVGQAIGRGDEPGARRVAIAGLLCAISFMSVSAIVFRAIPGVLAHLYTHDPAVAALAALLIPIAGIFQVFDGTQAVAAGILRGAGDTRAPMIVNILGFWCIGLPTSAWFAFHLHGGAVGLWWGIVAGLAAVAIFLVIRIRFRLTRSLQRIVIDDALLSR
jgi:MATE family multidrug resistance protein